MTKHIRRKISIFNPASMFKPLAKQGKTEEAISHYREAVRINPGYFSAYNNLGTKLVRMRKYDDAIFYYRKALQLEQNNPGIHLNLGAALVDKGELKEGIEHFQTAVYLNPDYADARRALKMALEIEKRQKRN
jgi:tetratricopeptide (TPR) repeat protein